MGQNIDISGLVCWHVTPKYTILLLEDLSTIMSGTFLTLTMAKAKMAQKTLKSPQSSSTQENTLFLEKGVFEAIILAL